MIRSLLLSIQEAATALIADTETMCEGEVADILSEEELQEMDTAIWEMVEIVK